MQNESTDAALTCAWKMTLSFIVACLTAENPESLEPAETNQLSKVLVGNFLLIHVTDWYTRVSVLSQGVLLTLQIAIGSGALRPWQWYSGYMINWVRCKDKWRWCWACDITKQSINLEWDEEIISYNL